MPRPGDWLERREYGERRSAEAATVAADCIKVNECDLGPELYGLGADI